jgi:hypothetical protein
MKRESTAKVVKREGTAFWLSDRDGALLRVLASVEDRTNQAILGRALRAYAEASQDYQRHLASSAPETPQPAAVAEPIQQTQHRRGRGGGS